MNWIKMMLIISIHIQMVLPRRRPHASEEMSSPESFENLLYFQDCSKKKEPNLKAANYAPPPQVIIREVTPPPPVCQCPAVCYSCCLTCPCPSAPPPIPLQYQNPSTPSPIPPTSFDPWSVNPLPPGRKSEIMQLDSPSIIKPPNQKKRRIPLKMLNSFRRSAGGNVKGLIEKDDDIKKILKDLVKITLKKVSNDMEKRNADNDQNAKNAGDEFPSSEVIVINEDDLNKEVGEGGEE